jgi:hypothetical protein
MTPFSQPERRGLERLQVPDPDSHPDPDLLTAFAEHALTPREKDQILGHLGQCALCRETVALSGSPLVEPVPEPVRQRAFWEIPLLRWGALAATAVIVVAAVSVGTLSHRNSPTSAYFGEAQLSSHKTEADKVVAEPNAPVALSDSNAVAKTAPQSSRRAIHLQEQVRFERPDAVTLKDAPKAKQDTLVAGAATAGLLAKSAPTPAQNLAVTAKSQSQLQQLPSAAAKDESADKKQVVGEASSAAAAAAPSASPTKSAGNAEDSLSTLKVDRSNGAPNVRVENEVVHMNAESAAAARAERSKPSIFDQKKFAPRDADLDAASGSNSAVTVFRETRPISSAITGTTWQITNLGQLQRAFSGGLWTNMLSDHTFRTVAVVRDHIWAGGDNGLLYFSADNGSKWTQMPIYSGNTALTGHILRLRFTDTTHGTAETSTGETWATTDGGQSWQKQ